MNKRIILTIAVVVLVLGSLGTATFFYFKYQDASGNTADKQAREVVANVGKIMMLPDELPSVATVTDKSKLSGQKFFRNAENGDRVLIYPLASKAILYRPRLNKIVEVASVLPVQSNSPTPSAAATNEINSPTIVLYNGTTTVGLTTKYEKKINDGNLGFEVIGKEIAVRTDYQQTVVVDISGKYTDKVKDLANFLGAKIVKLPKGEAQPEADIVVILGKDSK